jgi:hypothetical protein
MRRPAVETLTAQQRSLEALIAEAVTVYEVEPFAVHDLAIQFQGEVRPGRGRDVAFLYADGDHIVTGTLDVYGNGSGLTVGEATWTHSGSDDECVCGLGDCAVVEED